MDALLEAITAATVALTASTLEERAEVELVVPAAAAVVPRAEASCLVPSRATAVKFENP